MQICGAKTRSGNPCKGRPMPNGRCRMHGGCSLAGVDSPRFTHGRYSRYGKVLAERFREHVDDSDNDPLDILPELEVQRALFADYLRRFNGESITLSAGDISVLMQWSADITRTVERVVKMKNETALTKAEVTFLAARIADIVSEFIPDADRQQAFIHKLFSGFSAADSTALESGKRD